MTLTAVTLAALMFGLEISSVPVILPTLGKLFRATFKDLQWIMDAYIIACTTVLMATGTLADRFGRKLLFIINVIAFGITSLVCGLATNVSMLIVSRFLQGLAGGAMLICMIAILSHQFQEAGLRAKAFALWGIVFGTGLGFGPIIGGIIIAMSNWQWVFLIHTALALVAFVLAWIGVTESRDPHEKHLDIAGIISLSIAVFSLAFYITQGRDLGYRSTVGYGIVAAFAVSSLVFVIAEKLAPHPMFDFAVLRMPDFSGSLFGSMGMNFSFWPFIVYLPIYYQSALGYNSKIAGLALLAYTLPTLVVPPLGERLLQRYRASVVIPFGLFVIGLGFMLIWIGSAATSASWLTMLPGSMIAGTGLGLTNTPVTNTITGSVSRDRAGMASGIDMSARLISLAINIALMGFILLAGVVSCLRQSLPASIDSAYLYHAAERIAGGDINSFGPQRTSSSPVSIALAHEALIRGFRWATLYGGLCVCTLAAGAMFVFGWRKLPQLNQKLESSKN